MKPSNNELRPAAQVYWREAQEGQERGQAGRALVALDLHITE